MERIEAEIETVIPFFDLDPLQIVWHGHYAKYFELARCEVLAAIDYGYQAMKDSGYAWPVIDLHIRYLKPARLGQKIICKAWILEFENQLKISYEIRCSETAATMTRGSTVQVAVNMSNEEMQLVSPRVLHEKMRAAYENA